MTDDTARLAAIRARMAERETRKAEIGMKPEPVYIGAEASPLGPVIAEQVAYTSSRSAPVSVARRLRKVEASPWPLRVLMLLGLPALLVMAVAVGMVLR